MALERLRLQSLTDRKIWDGLEPLNVTVKAVRDEDGEGGRIIITGNFPDSVIINFVEKEFVYRYRDWDDAR